jgi:RNA polymerase sigma factor (sigma-70 family)
MPDPQALEALFLDNLGWVERASASIGRRYGLDRDETEDFASWIKLKLIEDDYAVYRKFRGDSSITTYLTVVVAMLFRDYRAHRWGRWRPSAAARRRGPLAIRLETLVNRDGYRLEQAGEILRTTGETTLSDRELAALMSDLPVRGPARPVEVGPEPVLVVPAPTGADERVALAERQAERQTVDGELTRAIEALPPEDRLILRMRFWEDLSVADIARGLDRPQKPLYRRLDRLLVQLRRHLEAAGMSRERTREILHDSTTG